MYLSEEPFDRERQDRDLVEALLNPQGTALYLDTSALVWLYRIREKARTELITFLDKEGLRDRSHIPAWSLHELNKHRKSPKTLFPLVEQHRLLLNAIDQIKSNARLFVDDKFAKANGWPAADDYFAVLDDAAAGLAKAAKPLNKAAEVHSIDAELAPFLQSHALQRSLPQLAPLRAEFAARCEGRLPPGYEDRSKGADRVNDDFSGANRFGDYVFWRSVMEHAADDETIKTVVIVSHDAKPDWVHLPANYIGYGEKRTSNNKKGSARVTCPQPILAFEIGVHAGVEQLLIVSIMQLVSAFAQTGNGSDLKELARAIQIEQIVETEEPGFEATGLDAADANAILIGETAVACSTEQPADEQPKTMDDGVVGPAPTSGADLFARLAALDETALADVEYVGDQAGNAEADEVIASLKTHNWYVQNPAVFQSRQVIIDPATSDTQLFVIGRNLYQAACGGAFRAVDFLPGLGRLRGDMPVGGTDLLLAGTLYEAYFDAHGELRARPKHDHLSVLFDLAETKVFEAVAGWLHAQLGPSLKNFIIVPGGARARARFEVVKNHRPIGIWVEGVEVTEHAMPDEDGWDPDSLPNRGTQERMTRTLATHFCLPESRVDVEISMADVLDLHHLRLKPWSTDGSLSFY